MKPERNNDIDLLLRQLSGRNGSPVSENGEQHLDADELNSYVAKALPPAARARYTEHLADCSSCRQLVAQLSAVQGAVPAQQSATVVAPSGLKSFLASLFSPMVLRYAVPALGLVVIAVVGIFVFNQKRSASSLAQNTPADQTSAAVPGGLHDSALPRGYPNDNNTQLNKPPDEKDAQRRANGPVAPVTRDDAPATATKQAAPDTSAAAAEPAPPAPKAAAEAEDDRREDARKLKKEPAVEQPAVARDAAKERADEGGKNEPQKTESTDVTVAPNTVTRRNLALREAQRRETNSSRAGSDYKRAPKPATGTATSQEEAKDQSYLASTETRSVAGRSFRKSRNVWIDTGYDSSKPITNVARGSEQYRALVADEPSIREIADHLDGQIIVVWKGRTYRIR
jgi:putative zinc finger protein